MWALIDGGAIAQIIYAARPVTVGGVKYPRTIFTAWPANDLAALGIVPATIAAAPDERFFAQTDMTWTIAGDGQSVTGTPVTAPRPLSEIRAALSAAVEAEATRRINAMADERDQRALLALGTNAILEHGPDPVAWPAELQATLAAARPMWEEARRLRTVEAAKIAAVEAAAFETLATYSVTEGWNAGL